MDNINTILIERKNNYGSFKNNAELTQGIIGICNKYYNYKSFDNHCIKEVIHMVSHKIARIICGNYFYKDSYLDIIGYATICIEELGGEVNNNIDIIELYNNHDMYNDIKKLINKHELNIGAFDIYIKLFNILCLLPNLLNDDDIQIYMLLNKIIYITNEILKEHFNES